MPATSIIGVILGGAQEEIWLDLTGTRIVSTYNSGEGPWHNHVEYLVIKKMEVPNLVGKLDAQ